jgi:hypothetical protein
VIGPLAGRADYNIRQMLYWAPHGAPNHQRFEEGEQASTSELIVFLEMTTDEWCKGGDEWVLQWFLCGNAKPIIRYRFALAFSKGSKRAKKCWNDGLICSKK